MINLTDEQPRLQSGCGWIIYPMSGVREKTGSGMFNGGRHGAKG